MVYTRSTIAVSCTVFWFLWNWQRAISCDRELPVVDARLVGMTIALSAALLLATALQTTSRLLRHFERSILRIVRYSILLTLFIDPTFDYLELLDSHYKTIKRHCAGQYQKSSQTAALISTSARLLSGIIALAAHTGRPNALLKGAAIRLAIFCCVLCIFRLLHNILYA